MKGRRRTRILGALAVGLAAASLARADAPPDQYGNFDQASVTITDDFTHLTWQRNVPAASFDYVGGAAYCASLAPYGGKPWRLPSYKELLTLVDESPHEDFVTGTRVFIDPNAFPQTPVDEHYLTSSIQGGSPSQVYLVDFAQGVSLSDDLGQVAYRVRCVTP